MLRISTYIELLNGKPYNAIALCRSSRRISRWDGSLSREDNLRAVAGKMARSRGLTATPKMVPSTKPSEFLYWEVEENRNNE